MLAYLASLPALVLKDITKVENYFCNYKFYRNIFAHYRFSLLLTAITNLNLIIMEQPKTTSKEVIKVSYAKSGVKTLSGFATFFFVIAILSSVVAFVTFIWFLSELGGYHNDSAEALAVFTSFIYVALACYLSGAICAGLSSIAETALMKRSLLEKDYYFEEKKSSMEVYGGSVVDRT